MRLVSLAIALFVFWILLSGHFDAFLLGAGAIVAVLIALFGRSFGYADEEGHPAELILPGLLYWPWLAKEIVLSTLSVARIVVSPSMPISPRLFQVYPTQKTAVGVVTYANSITLTPGTITIEADRDIRHKRLLVIHALTDDGAEGVKGGEMDRHVTGFEGKS